MTIKGGTSQACAACKFQRRKCTAECLLAPYFPPNDPKKFENAHRLFGVSNITKILKKINQADHKEAMRSIIYEANARDKYPTHGCVGIIIALQEHIQQTQQELELVLAYLSMCKQQQQEVHPEMNQDHSVPNTLALFQTQHEGRSVFGTDYETNQMSVDWGSQFQMDNNNINGDCNLMSSYVENGAHHDVKQTFIQAKMEAYESSSESSIRNHSMSFEHDEENELKNAAADLSLTSI